MKSLKLSIVFGTFAALLAGCQSHEHAAATGNAKPYPLNTCIVSDEKLGSMGDPIVDVYNGQQIKFCCKSCVADFKKEPQKFMAKVK